MTVSTSVEIAAPADRVWAVMADVERWHEWTASITSIERLDTGPFGPGSRVRIKQPKFPPAIWTVTALDEGRGFEWISRSPGVAVTARHTIDAAARGSRVTLSLQYGGLLGPLLGRLTRGVTDRYVGLEAAGLKRRSEAGAAAPGGR